jgi:hypothetical protein
MARCAVHFAQPRKSFGNHANRAHIPCQASFANAVVARVVASARVRSPMKAFCIAATTAIALASLPLQSAAPATTSRYADLILADKPAAYWRLNDDASGTVKNIAPGANATALDGKVEGKVTLRQAAQSRELFPEFEPDSTAAGFSGKGEFIRVKDPGGNSPLDFKNGDSITIEAWVLLNAIKDGQQVYVIGKGRTGNKGFAADNQNWALRVRGQDDAAAISFLFRDAEAGGTGVSPVNSKSKMSKEESEKHWHRWTSNDGFIPGSGWHHIAVTYTFGKSASIKGYIDGAEVKGTWDMGGKSDAPPVVDDDEVWIGSSMGGQAASTFNGLINEVAVHRRALAAASLLARFNHVPPAPKLADTSKLPKDRVLVELIEGISASPNWNFTTGAPIESWAESAFAFTGVPTKYSPRGVRVDRSNPFLLRATAKVTLPAGEHRLLLRSLQSARLFMDGKLLGTTKFIVPNGSGHGQVEDPPGEDYPHALRFARTGHHEHWVAVQSKGGDHIFALEGIIGGKSLKPEVGELTVSISRKGELFHLLAPKERIPHTDDAWTAFADAQFARRAAADAMRRNDPAAEEYKYWARRHELARKTVTAKPAPSVPRVAATTPVLNDIDRFIGARLEAAKVQSAPLTDDLAFLRRIALDTVGVPPTPAQIEVFLKDTGTPQQRRARAIDRFLALPGWADNWVGYWQDVLAENPAILKPTLNNTGPFRWWIHESFSDNKPMDRFATELIAMEGSVYGGGPAGFGLATQNDVPMADRAQIVSSAFLAMNLACARCHDAPYHEFKQKDLFSLAAMLKQGAQEVPASSSIPANANIKIGRRVHVTLKPGEKVEPHFPFNEVVHGAAVASLARDGKDSREQLAAFVTAPENDRFAQVIVNRVWKRYLGAGFIEPVDDWEDAKPSHPALLAWLARELVTHDYDLKHVARLIFNSHTYQRQAGLHTPKSDEPADRLFASPSRRRMMAEQVVDSMFAVTGKQFQSELLTLDNDCRRPAKDFLNLGAPRRAWEFTGLSNDRDRPALSLPKTQAIVDVLAMFGWREARQNSISTRDHSPNVLQPAALANGDMANARVTRLSDDCDLVDLLVKDRPLPAMVEAVFVRFLSRPPTAGERETFVNYLAAGYKERVQPAPPRKLRKDYDPTLLLSWSNHLNAKSTEIKYKVEEKARLGDEPTPRLAKDWRERMEDVLWAMVNSPEFVFVP